MSTIIDEHIFGDVASFRSQYMRQDSDLDELRQRLAPFTKRTLRNQVQEYIRYTERRLITQPFRPSDDEHRLYESISTFLLREDTYAIPTRQQLVDSAHSAKVVSLIITCDRRHARGYTRTPQSCCAMARRPAMVSPSDCSTVKSSTTNISMRCSLAPQVKGDHPIRGTTNRPSEARCGDYRSGPLHPVGAEYRRRHKVALAADGIGDWL